MISFLVSAVWLEVTFIDSLPMSAFLYVPSVIFVISTADEPSHDVQRLTQYCLLPITFLRLSEHEFPHGSKERLGHIVSRSSRCRDLRLEDRQESSGDEIKDACS